MHKHQRNIAGGSVYTPQAYLKYVYTVTGGLDEIGNAAAVNIMTRGSAGAALWIGWMATDVRDRFINWWRSEECTPYDRDLVQKRFCAVALPKSHDSEHGNDMQWWRFWRRFTHHVNVGGKPVSIWGSILIMLRCGAKL
jgi:hypothetical protein